MLQTRSISLQSVVMQTSTSESEVPRLLPVEPKTLTLIEDVGHLPRRIWSSFSIKFDLRCSLSALGCNSSYNFCISCDSFSFSSGVRRVFNSDLCFSNGSGPSEYGTRRLALAIPVSYLQPPYCFRPAGGVLLLSDGNEIGELFFAADSSEGEALCSERDWGRWKGVDGIDFDWEGLWLVPRREGD